MQKRAGYREALTLTAGEVASLLRESRIKPILRGEELPEIHFSSASMSSSSEAFGQAMSRLSLTVPAKI